VFSTVFGIPMPMSTATPFRRVVFTAIRAASPQATAVDRAGGARIPPIRLGPATSGRPKRSRAGRQTPLAMIPARPVPVAHQGPIAVTLLACRRAEARHRPDGLACLAR
jgi:hypothetical protein